MIYDLERSGRIEVATLYVIRPQVLRHAPKEVLASITRVWCSRERSSRIFLGYLSFLFSIIYRAQLT